MNPAKRYGIILASCALGAVLGYAAAWTVYPLVHRDPDRVQSAPRVAPAPQTSQRTVPEAAEPSSPD